MKSVISEAKQIVCILPKGRSSDLEKGLIDEFGIYESNFHHARGVGRAHVNGIGAQSEKEIFEVVVLDSMADQVFEYLYFRADMDKPHGGLMYMTAAPKITKLEVADIEPSN